MKVKFPQLLQKNKKKLKENIQKYKDEGSFTKAEMIQNAFRKVYPEGYGEYQSLLRITLNDHTGIKNFYFLNNNSVEYMYYAR